MRLNLLVGFLLLTQVLFAQTFTEVVPEFDGVGYGSIAFSDVDGDNDQDLLITGYNNSGVPIAKLYTNDGMGNFIEMTGTPFDGVAESSIAFSDVDGDNDQDLLITGYNISYGAIAKLYTNDGMGNFTEMTGTPFASVAGGSIAFSDVDGDNDQDLLITGYNISYGAIAKLYTNDGTGNFAEMMGTPFDGVSGGSIAFSDVDGDNDQDLVITGMNNSNVPIAKLYTNDGMGNFTVMTGTPFNGVYNSSIAFSDVDGDNDQDLLITGHNTSYGAIAKLYTNDGMGNFTEMTGTPLTGVRYSSIAFSDVDGDNDQDLLITGLNNSNERITKLYTNDGMGNFTVMTGTPFEGISESSIAFSDVDGDNDQDLLMIGPAKLYTNDGMGNFTKKPGIPLDGIRFSSIAFSDVDGDNDPDLFITGAKNPSGLIARLYTNDGMGNFTVMTGTPFAGVYYSSIAFSDVDGDNDPDLLITGRIHYLLQIARLYTNDGMGNFTEMTGTPFDVVGLSSIAFSDVDGDNDPDLLITGEKNSGLRIAKLYTNDGMGNFTVMTGTPFDGVSGGSIAFSDVDGDNDQDLLITGMNNSNVPIAKLYTNDGMGNFTVMAGTPFDGVGFSSIAFSDVDGDNDPDLLITGVNNSGLPIAKLYTNDGMGNFTEMAGTPFDGVGFSSIAFSDVDGDNDPDLLITGENNSGLRIAKLYTNDGMGNFTETTGTPFDGVYNSSIAFSDVDGDNDPDLLITGENNSEGRIAKLYINDGMVSSTDDLIPGYNLVITTYPNPTKSNMLNANFDSTENGFAIVKVYDLNGHLLRQQKVFTVTGRNTISMDIASLSPGSYFIQLDNGKRKGVAKFIVQ